MVPDKFNMVDMDGIDLIMMQGEEVPGLYMRLVESIAQCRYQCLYNWFFDGVLIPPSYVEMEVNEDDEVAINEGVTVSPDDVIHIYSLEPGPVDPEIIPLLAEENDVYYVPEGVDGFNPVTVNVPSYTPVIESITITENGTYNVPVGVDGYAPVIVNVEGSSMVLLFSGSGVAIQSVELSDDADNYKYLIVKGHQPTNPPYQLSVIWKYSATEKVGFFDDSHYMWTRFNTKKTFYAPDQSNFSVVIDEIYGIN